ncbi:hypothetical protein FALBO_12695 [Fusarium albosuccineum]|uniref:Uncharacterized protein n=1 Tax=Fusarium albosuccineum TaxID=1237068 RepID=A0A8H4L3H0_9HYPO|nr:hypothetical protein FALBO_12695 [Fusarium albosuccineum]
MDLDASRPRLASQSSHGGTYKPHERPSDFSRLRIPSQPRLPYQSLNETSALLRSPGPLESMLKTTTETGDIGIFSIKTPMSAVTYHYPQRPRPDFKGPRRPSRPYYRGLEDGPVRDDRKSLPSYRDTASEIISLYGSTTQPSYPRSFSPSSDGDHRPSKPKDYHGYRRYPPLSLRPGFSRSTSSLPSRVSPKPRHYSPGSGRSRMQSTMPYWVASSQCRQTSSSGQSIRSASLTSIVEMYQGMSPNRDVLPPRSPRSFYYDYTEEFDTESTYELEHAVPLCPIPQSGEGMRRPLLLRADGMEHADETDLPPMTYSDADSYKDQTDSILGRDGQSQINTNHVKASQPSLDKRQSFYGDTLFSRTTSTRSSASTYSRNALTHARRVHSNSAPPAHASSVIDRADIDGF